MKAKKSYVLRGNRVYWRGCLIGEIKGCYEKWQSCLGKSHLTAFFDSKKGACEWLVTQFVNGLVSQVNLVLDLNLNSKNEK